MVISLEKQSSLPLTVDLETFDLAWSKEVVVETKSRRSFLEMKELIREPEARASRDPIYWVWRQMCRRGDKNKIAQAGLRYDLTIIPPGRFVAKAKEFFRTAGHYHKGGRPEVYEVLHGRVYWIIQRRHFSDPSRIEEIYVVEAGIGEKAIMPPGFGHISVNPFDQPLILANWIDSSVQYDYKPYADLRGAGYWVMEGPAGQTVEFEKNGNYALVPELKKLKPKEAPGLGLLRSVPLYEMTHDLAKLNFLKTPKRFSHALALDRCYREIV